MAQRWAGLSREIELLRRQFLPNPFDPLGNYPHALRVQAHTRAFLVLSHAEIETFLEAWAKDLAGACERVWKRTRRVVDPMVFLVGTIGGRIPGAPANAQSGASDCHQRFADVVAPMFKAYYKRISDNNGVKEKNFLELFDPLGVPASAVSGTLFPHLNDLGKMRGKHAHHSRQAVQSILDPETEYSRIVTVLQDLKAFDKWLVTYRRTIR